MENLDLLNSELLENQFYHLKNIGRYNNEKKEVVISGFTYSTGVVQPLSKIEKINSLLNLK